MYCIPDINIIFRSTTKTIAVLGNAIDLLARYVFKKFKFLFFW